MSNNPLEYILAKKMLLDAKKKELTNLLSQQENMVKDLTDIQEKINIVKQEILFIQNHEKKS